MDSPSPTRPFLSRLFISPEERRLRAGWRLLSQMVLLVVFLIALGLPAGLVYLVIPGVSMDALLLISAVISAFAITASVYLARRALDRRSFTSLGLIWNRQALIDILVGIGITGLMLGLVYLVERAAGWLDFQGFTWETESTGRVLASTLAALIVFILVGWQEELLSRGYWLQNLRDGLNLAWGVLISSAFFALAHAANPNASWEAMLGLFAGGLFLAYGYVRTRQLWLPIGLHIGWNLFEGTVYGFPVSGSPFFTLVRQTVQGPEWITGGDFGPEAGLIILPALLVGAGLIYLYTRSRFVRRA